MRKRKYLGYGELIRQIIIICLMYLLLCYIALKFIGIDLLEGII